MAGLVKFGGSSKTGMLRTGAGTRAIQWLEDEFGESFPQELTNDSARAIAQSAQKWQHQAWLWGQAKKHYELIFKSKADIERIRADLIKQGLSSKEATDKAVAETLKLAARHEGHIARIAQDTQNAVALERARTGLDLQYGQSAFQQRLRQAQAAHRAKMAGLKDADQFAKTQSKAAQRLAAARQSATAFVNSTDTKGKHYQKRRGLFGLSLFS